MKTCEMLGILKDISDRMHDSFDIEKGITFEQKYLVYFSGIEAAILTLIEVDRINKKNNIHE